MPTILIVDDLASDRELAGGLLQKDDGLSIIYATNGIARRNDASPKKIIRLSASLLMDRMNRSRWAFSHIADCT